MECVELVDAFQAYLLGNFQIALKSLQKLKAPNPDVQLKADILTYRIYIAQKKYGIVLDEITEDSESIELSLVRLLAEYFTNPDNPDILKKVDKVLAGNLNADDETSLIIGATIYMNARMFEAALKLLHQGHDINCNALTVQCLMSINRYDLAGKVVRRMQVSDEDALACQLTTALFYLSKGGEQLQEALHIYEELREKYGSTPVVLNGQAAALIGMNRWEDAECLLQEALDADSNNPDTIINMIMVSQHLGKPAETIHRLMSELKDCNKNHPFLLDYAAKEEEFSRCAQQYAPSVSS
ncbi:unnamed protein product [Calicophoron daubneyi]|uniref:Coatomer subunit epsilon n=1 Tax=Calicophoron daubneyi TaxID=300641 RepID=A0AAV2TIW4_CALDB